MGTNHDDAYEDFQPEVDALDRFERVIDTQIETLRTIDEKAAHVTQLVSILLGVVLTGFTLIWQTDGIGFETRSMITTIIFSLGMVFLFSALFTGIGTYLASRYHYGLHRNVHTLLRTYRTTGSQYVELIQGGYSDAIKQNKRIVTTNVRRFHWSLSFLLLGILHLASATLLFVFPLGIGGRVMTLVSVLVTSGMVLGKMPVTQFYKSDGRTIST